MANGVDFASIFLFILFYGRDRENELSRVVVKHVVCVYVCAFVCMYFVDERRKF